MEQIVLLVGDNMSLLEQARVELNKYLVDFYDVKTVRGAVAELQRKDYALITMAADHMEGPLLECIRTIRSVSTLPILVLTRHYRPEMQAAAVKMGADLYIAVPETIPELIIIGVALVRRHLEFSRMTLPPPMMLEHSGLLLCVDHYRAYVYGIEVWLTPFEYNLLRLLLENKYRVLSHDQIFLQLWGDEYVGSPPHLITNLISKLRARLKVGVDAPEYIRTVRGAGYKFDPQ